MRRKNFSIIHSHDMYSSRPGNTGVHSMLLFNTEYNAAGFITPVTVDF